MSSCGGFCTFSDSMWHVSLYLPAALRRAALAKPGFLRTDREVYLLHRHYSQISQHQTPGTGDHRNRLLEGLSIHKRLLFFQFLTIDVVLRQRLVCQSNQRCNLVYGSLSCVHVPCKTVFNAFVMTLCLCDCLCSLSAAIGFSFDVCLER